MTPEGPAFPPEWAGQFRVIYADPPWSYQNRALSGVADAHYDTQSDGWIEALPVADLAHPDGAALLMWGTWPKLREGIAVMDAWGFRYVTCAFVWRKVYASGLPYCGLGFYTRSGTEFCLLGLRGSLPPECHDVRQVVETHEPIVVPAEVGAHSAKPPEFYDAIERLFPGPRVELFSRSQWPGWEAWGNEVAPAMPLFQGGA